MSIGAAVHGRICRPVITGESPPTTCRYCAIRKTAPNRLPSRKNPAALPAANAASATAPPASAASTSGLVHPEMLPRTSAHTRANDPAESRKMPVTSTWARGPRLSGAPRPIAGISMAPMTTFTQKIHCQARPSTMAPPISGPPATASPVSPPQIPMAWPRRSAGNAPDRMVRAWK
jgi:hypothetical protein